MAKTKGSGYLTALIIAVVSFFVIFFFFPDAASRYLGVSFRKSDSATIERKVNSVKEKVAEEVTESVTESVRNLITK